MLQVSLFAKENDAQPSLKKHFPHCFPLSPPFQRVLQLPNPHQKPKMIQTARKHQSQAGLIRAWKTAGLKLGGSDTALGVKICRAQLFPDFAFPGSLDMMVLTENIRWFC